MRKLETDDMFLLSEIADKMDIKIDVKGKSQEEAGMELIFFYIKRFYHFDKREKVFCFQHANPPYIKNKEPN